MAKEKEKRTVSFSITIEGSEYDRIASMCKGDVVAEIGGLAEKLVSEFAKGGFMMTSQNVAHLSRSIGTPVSNAKDVIELAEKASSVKDGQGVVSFTLDPTALDVFAQQSAFNGWTVEELIQDAWNQIVDQGWLYALPLGATTFHLTEVERDAIAEKLGKKDFNGVDIAKHILGQ